MGFSVKIAPGVRIRASSHGVRASVGPRAARLHVGGGRAGFSSRVGPVGFYTSLAGSQQAGSTGRRGGAASSQRALAQAAKAQAAQELQAAMTRILTLYQQEFPITTRPVAADGSPVPVAAVRARHHEKKLKGIGLFKRSARRAAKAEADAAADAEILRLEQQRHRDRTQRQAELDRWWSALNANDEDVVLGVVAAAFDDNEAAAAPVGVEGSELTAVVLVPGIESVPEKKPATTAAGNLSLKKSTKTERSSLHTVLISSHVLLTVREALAVAPGITAIRAIAFRHSRTDAFGKPSVDVLMAARFDRARLSAVRWDGAEAHEIVQDAATELVINLKCTTHELLPIDLSGEPAIAELISHAEIGELIDRRPQKALNRSMTSTTFWK